MEVGRGGTPTSVSAYSLGRITETSDCDSQPYCGKVRTATFFDIAEYGPS